MIGPDANLVRQIVLDLAESSVHYEDGMGNVSCIFCGCDMDHMLRDISDVTRHDEDCVWRRAVLYRDAPSGAL